MSAITPTIGRKVWAWLSDATLDDTCSQVRDPRQAFDATVIFVHENGIVNLFVIDHEGQTGTVVNCSFREYVGGETQHSGDEDFCTWMPYQKSQAQKLFDEAKKEEGKA